MNTEKVNSTIQNLSQKYEETSWKNILPGIFQSYNFKTLLSELISDVEKGNKFSPSFKDAFSIYSNTNIKDLEVIFITDDPLTYTPEHIYKQGVINITIPMFTTNQERYKYDAISKEIVLDLISKLAYQTTGKIFVFIGKDAEEISSCVDNKHHRKVFLPGSLADVFLDGEINVKELINNMLKEPINW